MTLGRWLLFLLIAVSVLFALAAAWEAQKPQRRITRQQDPLFAAQLGQLDALKAAIVVDAGVVHRTDSYDRTPLHYAAERNHPKVVEFLVSHGAKLEARDRGGKTPLLMAAEIGATEAAEMLVRLGADLNARVDNSSGSYRHWGPSVLSVAAQKGDIALVQFLLDEGAPVIYGEGPGQDTALHAAATGVISWQDGETVILGNEAVIDLLASRIGGIDIRDWLNRTPLHRAASIGAVENIRHMLENDPDADLDVQNSGGDTPLHEAAGVSTFDPPPDNQAEIIRLLLEHEATPNIKNKEGETPLDLALKFGEPAVVRAFNPPQPATKLADPPPPAEKASSDGDRSNQPPVFDSERPYQRIVAYSTLDVFKGTIETITADDSDGDQLQYRLRRSQTEGEADPQSSVSAEGLRIDETTGEVTIENPAIIEAAYRRDFRYDFTVVADDGQSTDSIDFTLYDSAPGWLYRAYELIKRWHPESLETLRQTEMHADAAIKELDEFVGLARFDGPVNNTSKAMWTNGDGALSPDDVGAILKNLIKQSVAAHEDNDDATFWGVRNAIEEVSNRSSSHITSVVGKNYTRVNNLKSTFREDENSDPAHNARLAFRLYRDLVEELSFDPADPASKIEAPSKDDLLGWLLVAYADDNDYDLDWKRLKDGNLAGVGRWTSDDLPSPGWINGNDIAEKLNQIKYQSN